jgi:hypothetical protein
MRLSATVPTYDTCCLRGPSASRTAAGSLASSMRMARLMPVGCRVCVVRDSQRSHLPVLVR